MEAAAADEEQMDPTVQAVVEADRAAFVRVLNKELVNTGNATADPLNGQIKQHFTTAGVSGVSDFIHMFPEIEDCVRFINLCRGGDDNEVLKMHAGGKMRKVWHGCHTLAPIVRAENGQQWSGSTQSEDTPLPSDVAKGLRGGFKEKYSCLLPMDKDPCDPDVARLFRQRKATQQSVVLMAQCKSQDTGSFRSEPEKIAIGHDVEIMMKNQNHKNLPITSCVEYINRLLVHGAAQAIIGCDKVPSKRHIGTHVEYAPYHIMENYAKDALTASDKWQGSKESRLAKLQWLDERTRAHAVYKSRNEGWPYGEALVDAWREKKTEWIPYSEEAWIPSHSFLHTPVRSQERSRPAFQSPNKRQRTSGGPFSPPQGSKREQPSGNRRPSPRPLKRRDSKPQGTVQHLSGKEICKRFNHANCSDPCPEGRLHVCDVKMPGSGKGCGSSSHPRTKHPSH